MADASADGHEEITVPILGEYQPRSAREAAEDAAVAATVAGQSGRLRRLIHGQTCPVCKRKRRLKWYADTGCCSRWCLRVGLTFAPRRSLLGELRYDHGN